MATKDNGSGATSVSSESTLRAILALLADEREARVVNDRSARKTEVLLADAGLSIGEIGTLLGKNYDTVKTTIRRSRAK
jgi:DNA-directed RNA polymerase specialized sigma24 family protein